MSAAGTPQAEQRAILFDTEPTRSLLPEIAKLVDPVTGSYSFPPDKAFDDYKKIHADGFRGEGQVVAIVDTGIDRTHPMLRDAIVDARDFTDEGTTDDLHGHGTLVSLIIHYCAPEATLINAKAFGRSGSGSESALAAALDWVGTKRPAVVNLSGGIPRDDPAKFLTKVFRFYFSRTHRDHWLVSWLRRHRGAPCPVCAAADRLTAANIGVCVAVGNQRGMIICPGRTRNRGLTVVGAASVIGPKKSVPSYSALWPDLVAPELPVAEGTSFSTPFVTGLMALLTEVAEKGMAKASAEASAKIESELRRADDLFARGEFAAAATSYTSALANIPHVAEHAAGKIPAGACELCQAVVYTPRMKLGHAYLQLGQPRAAVAPFKENVDIAPEFPDAYMNWGAALRSAGRAQEAVATYQHALRLDPARAEAYDGLGDSYWSAGATFYTEASEAFERSLTIQPYGSYALARLADVSEARGEADRAAKLRAGQFASGVQHLARAQSANDVTTRIDEAGAAADLFAGVSMMTMAASAWILRASALCGRARVLQGTQWTVNIKDAADAQQNAMNAITALAQPKTPIDRVMQGRGLSWSARALTLLAETDHSANERAIGQATDAIRMLSQSHGDDDVTSGLAHAYLHLARAFYFRKQCYTRDRAADSAQIVANASKALELAAGRDAYVQSEGEWLIAQST